MLCRTRQLLIEYGVVKSDVLIAGFRPHKVTQGDLAASEGQLT